VLFDPDLLHNVQRSRATTFSLGLASLFFVIAATPLEARGQANPPSSVRAVGGDTVDHHAVNAVVYNGWKMFEVYCTRCHGEDAVGSSFAPALIKSVTNGRPTKGMPTWGNLLSPEQKEDVWYYLRARAVGGLAPGRPHIAPHANRDSTALPPSVGQDTTWAGPPANS
jgi:mono/diheme cytochrome c family protein